MEIKEPFSWEEKFYDKPRHNILKSRNISLVTKVHTVRTMVLPVDMYSCTNLTIKKTEIGTTKRAAV